MYKLLCTALMMSLLISCGGETKKSTDAIADLISSRAAALNTVTPEGYLKLKSVERTSTNPKAYLVIFETDMRSMLTVPVSDGDKHAYEYNLKITQAWAKRFCTPVIKATAKVNEVSMIAGTLVDGSGKRYSSTSCY